MKVAFIDNTCNHGYTVMRYLNDKGYDTDLLLLTNEKGHLDPYADMIEKKYEHKIKRLHWDKGFWKVPTQKVKAVRKEYDFIFGADWTPGLFYRANKALDAFVPHGNDLFDYAFIKRPTLRTFSKITFGNWLASLLQRKGIERACRYMIFDETNEENESYVRALNKPSFKRINTGIPLLYFAQYNGSAFQDFCATNPYCQQLKQLKKEGYTLIFHHCQQIWKNSISLFNKGNDKLIKAFAQVVLTGGEQVKLIMIERGEDVAESKKLISELGISEQVLWLPTMTRNDIMACLSLVDIGAGEFGHSWYSYNVVYEFLCMGVPVIHWRDDSYFQALGKELYPMYSAESIEEIKNKILLFFKDKLQFKDTGLQAKNWFRNNLVQRQVAVLESLLLDTVQK